MPPAWADEPLHGQVIGVAGGFTVIGLVFSMYERQISAWLERQDQITKESADAYRQAHMTAEAEQAERDRTREIADQEMDRLAAERRPREPVYRPPTSLVRSL